MTTPNEIEYSDHIPHFVTNDDIRVCSECDAKPYNHKPVDPNRDYSA